MRPGNIVAVAGVTEAFNPDQEGENYTRTLMRFANGATATLEMGRYDQSSFHRAVSRGDAQRRFVGRSVPGARYGPEPWRYRVLGTKGEVRVVAAQNSAHVEPDVVLCV